MRGVVIALLLAGCSEGPTPTGTVCPTPDPGEPTYEDFGKPFMERYCLWCHDSVLMDRSLRNGAPLFHDFDTLLGILEIDTALSDHIDEQTGIGPDASNRFMPPDRCPSTIGGSLDRDCLKPTDDERRQLALWLACERDRPHNFRPDAGIDGP
jgi:hypothetical protein